MIEIDGRYLIVVPPISLVPVKNLLAKTTSKPLADVPDDIGVLTTSPDEIYLFSVLDGRETSKPNSKNFIFSLMSMEIKSLLNLKYLPTNEPFLKFTKFLSD